MSHPIVTIQHLSFGPSPQKKIPYCINATVTPGKILWIQGPNGSGKSSLIRTLLNHGHVFSGTFTMPPHTTIAYLPQLQNKRVPWPLTLHDVLKLTTKHSTDTHRLLSSELLQTSWNTASGGERQRLLLTRLFQKKPALIIIDEPLNHLDKESKHHVIELLKDYIMNQGALIIVEHDTIPPQLTPYIDNCITLGDY